MLSQIRHALACRAELYGPAEPVAVAVQVIGGGLLVALIFIMGGAL